MQAPDHLQACRHCRRERLRTVAQEVNDPWRPLPWEQVKKFLQLPFTIDGGELTPTLKLKRKPIMAKYGEAVEAMYN